MNQLYNGEIAIDSVPTEWQEEIQRRVNERIVLDAEQEPTTDEKATAYDILMGGEDYINTLKDMGVEI